MTLFCLVYALVFLSLKFFIICTPFVFCTFFYQAALDLARKMQRFPVVVPQTVASSTVGTNYVKTETSDTEHADGPILCLHGFDSSVLEFRRLLPKLGSIGANAYAVDVLGWGFTDVGGVQSFGAGMRVTVITRHEAVPYPVVRQHD